MLQDRMTILSLVLYVGQHYETVELLVTSSTKAYYQIPELHQTYTTPCVLKTDPTRMLPLSDHYISYYFL